ncbi:uncharacterized protein LOC130719072 [Lotus japonicus]|uniref:uncharacterized protein LOC130719072 n=1 Tax=Lotus japonicus TaxID=34305 RepID=UPI00258C3BB4|nr:uncharacterized protein LOC130719072 [Lotus japonicus]
MGCVKLFRTVMLIRQTQNGCRPFSDDKNVLRFLDEHRGHDEITFYIEKLTNVPETLDALVINKDVVYDEVEIATPPEVTQPKVTEPEVVTGSEHIVEESVVAENIRGPRSVAAETVVGESVVAEPVGAESVVAEPEVVRGDESVVAEPEVVRRAENLESPAESDEEIENVKRKFPKFKVGDEDVVIKFEVDQVFTNANLFRNVVRDYALQNKKDLVFNKNDRKRIVIKCKDECPFYLRASKHTPHMKIKALAEEARNRSSVRLSRYQVSRAIVKALAMIEGETLEQYKHLRSYSKELRLSTTIANPYSSNRPMDHGAST